MTDTTAATRARILTQIEGCKSNGVDFTALVCEKANCAEASVDAVGDVWIEGPQSGQWLDEEALAELADWIDAQ